MNRNLFAGAVVIPSTTLPLTTNEAGGVAFQLPAEAALAQYAVTGTLHNTMYAGAQVQLDKVLEFARACAPEYVAKIAVYAHLYGHMKDIPVLLLAYLSTINTSLFMRVFPMIVTNIGQLRGFVQVIRSGQVGRKSLGTAPKNAIEMFLRMGANQIFWQCIGTAPSLKDVLCLAHPKPSTTEHEALFAYLLDKGKEYSFGKLPSVVQEFEAWKALRTSSQEDPCVPNVDWRRLTTFDLSDENWVIIAKRMTWNQLRLNLNQLQRHNVFSNPEMETWIAQKLENPTQVLAAPILPLALYSTIQATTNVPPRIREALEHALEIALSKAPTFDDGVSILIDESGSMAYEPLTGSNGKPSELKCFEGAKVFAAALIKSNAENFNLIGFDTKARTIEINTKDNLATISRSFKANGGGTNLACGMQHLLESPHRHKHVVILSDNESWYTVVGSRHEYQITGAPRTSTLWNDYKRQVPEAKLFCVNLQPYATTQVDAQPGVYNLGGFTDNLFDCMRLLDNGVANYWPDLINSIQLP